MNEGIDVGSMTGLIRNTIRAAKPLIEARTQRMLCAAVILAFFVQSGKSLVVADQTDELSVYYLSPQVLTRIAVTPERLERSKFKIDATNLLVQRIKELVEEIRSNKHESTNRSRFAYDFRLCFVSESLSMCFSGDGSVGYVSDAPFQLSASEKEHVLNLFRELDHR